MPIDDSLLGERTVAAAHEMTELGQTIGERLVAGDVLILTGPLGAGKTTFTRGLARGLGVRGPIQSPTFVIARTHPSLVGGAPLIHMDAYRLGSAAELDDLDIDLDNSVVVIEWGRGLAEDLADTWYDIDITRPTGADSVAAGTGPAATGATEKPDAGRTTASGVDSVAELAEDLDGDELRTVVIRRYCR